MFNISVLPGVCIDQKESLWRHTWGMFIYHEQLYVVLLDLVAGGLLNARVRYLRFAFTKNPWRHWEDFMQWCSHFSYWSGQLLNTIVRYLVFALTEKEKKAGDVIHAMIRLYLPITKKSVTSLRRFYRMMFAFFVDLVNRWIQIVRYLVFALTEKKSMTSYMTWLGYIYREFKVTD